VSSPVTPWASPKAPPTWADPVLSATELERLLSVGYQLWWAPAAHVVARVAAGEICDVVTLYTQPESRRQGHARALMQALIAHAQHHQAVGLTLEVRTDNLAAQALYRACGLVPIGIRPGYYPDGTDAALFTMKST
jgi:ribosomal-protein-alanine N-acetyltransferase